MKLVGLMSGTSMDGVDAALLEIGEEVGAPAAFGEVRWSLLAFTTEAYEGSTRSLLEGAVDAGDPETLCALHAELGEAFARVTLRLLQEAGVPAAEVAAIGSHGHTVRHLPPDGGRRGATLQLGDPATLAERTGVPVVSDFRAADVAAGGHGAPLVPWADRLLLSREGRSRALQNLGGIANVTWLPPAGDDAPPVAFDTGPGNVLLDVAAARAAAGGERFDRDGRRAAEGTVDRSLLEELLADPFYGRAPPRSTGRERFGPGLVDRIARERGLAPGEDEAGWADLLATFVRLTARSVADAYRAWVLPLGVDEVVLSGGGAHNPVLVAEIREALPEVPVRTGADALGVDPDAREALCFAAMAWAHLEGVPSNVPSVTGAAGTRVLGSLTPSPERSVPR